MNADFDLVTANELAGLLRLRPETVKRMARAGKIPSIRMSAKILRFSKNAVRTALDSAKATNPGEGREGVADGQK